MFSYIPVFPWLLAGNTESQCVLNFPTAHIQRKLEQWFKSKTRRPNVLLLCGMAELYSDKERTLLCQAFMLSRRHGGQK